MKRTFLSIAMLAGFITLFCFSSAWCAGAIKADNSAKNARDKSGESMTPVDQSQNPDDLRITREIRQHLNDDKVLSVNAKNVKIITAKGVITMRGPVNSLLEKSAINNYARQVAPRHMVDDDLEVKLNTTS